MQTERCKHNEIHGSGVTHFGFAVMRAYNCPWCEIEALQAALAAADRLAHEFTFSAAHAGYWAARERVGRCTVCNDPERADDLTHTHPGSGLPTGLKSE